MQAPQTSGNYIHKLQMTVREANSLANQGIDEMGDLIAYLSSSKFHEDPTVQVADVLRRIQPVKDRLADIAWATKHNFKPVIATGEITSL